MLSMAWALEKTKKIRCGVFLEVVTTSTITTRRYKIRCTKFHKLFIHNANEFNNVHNMSKNNKFICYPYISHVLSFNRRKIKFESEGCAKARTYYLIILETNKETLFFEQNRHEAAIKNMSRRSIRRKK